MVTSIRNINISEPQRPLEVFGTTCHPLPLRQLTSFAEKNSPVGTELVAIKMIDETVFYVPDNVILCWYIMHFSFMRVWSICDPVLRHITNKDASRRWWWWWCGGGGGGGGGVQYMVSPKNSIRVKSRFPLLIDQLLIRFDILHTTRQWYGFYKLLKRLGNWNRCYGHTSFREIWA